ncbi:ABC transporter ATP-binding protein [Microvirga lotononidis]|uniref:ABC-type polysaccharide/polyol phosphate transport system, ATPase component n=1 Tax=Microvirga lotononidis TaxID=864069 RepID=I4YQC2_9HYPH|nr:ABC transporter ATP-binding protein [Microvirga lotononidis]EIM26164.1 ABC-type polysaccharide/polyol phosphate transport system, ATPase component [Microvirga lotononidis]WQO26066.1 ABC transporter ATP-binding protein [Microvirga lotononidis]
MVLVKLENITLDFPVPAWKSERRRSSSQEKPIGGQLSAGRSGHTVVRALDQLSLTLGPGDRLALLGHNGAGKTTLLRVMAKLYAPTHGRVTIQGRVAPLLNLAFGMDMDSTGYDNIFIRGLFLGMSKAELRKKADAIAEFSELGDFLDLPMRTYSSGMRARLAFAISTHVETDILLLDEVVATGDARFFRKANQKLESFAQESKLLVLASHSNEVLRDLCNKALLLEHGRVKAFGAIDEVIETYASSKIVNAKGG